MKNELENEATQEVNKKVQSASMRDSDSSKTWIGLLIVYLSLFLFTGYLAFLRSDSSSKSKAYTEIGQITDSDTKRLGLASLTQEMNEDAKKEGLAIQAFNVVLGALLGFLSASATSYLHRRDRNG